MLTLGELVRLKRQNEKILTLVGELAFKASQTQKKELIKKQKTTKAALTRNLGVSPALLYYISKQLQKNLALKNQIHHARP